jgi:hypothetical protein
MKNQEFVNTVWDKTVEHISENPNTKDWFDGLPIEDKAALEAFTKGIAMTTRQPDLLPIDIENGPEADIKYFDKE